MFVFRNIINFCVATCLNSLQNLLISLLIDSFQCFFNLACLWMVNVLFIFKPFMSFVALSRAFRQMLNRTGDSGHLCALFKYLGKIFCHFIIMKFAIGFV